MIVCDDHIDEAHFAPFIPCTTKTLPDHMLQSAAEMAWAINPANRPHNAHLMPPQRIAVSTSKWWHNTGVNLTVGFMEQVSKALADKIVAAMNQWSPRANIKFTLSTTTSAQVRISLKPGGYWSYVGVDILSIPSNQPTMNLEGFNLSTPQSEYDRVIPHEAFHTCGGVHEHMRLGLVARLDTQKTLAYFERTQGWSEQEVRNQVLTPLNEASLMGTPVDQDSEMCYTIPGECTIDGLPIRGGTHINESDFAFAAKLYPLPNTPPLPVQPPVQPPTGNAVITFSGLLSSGATGTYKVG